MDRRLKTSDLSFINLNRAIRIVNELAEEYKDVHDTNVGKEIHVSEALLDKENRNRNTERV